jgi:asparagine synthase (glutamine-hydrolysing)
MRIPPRYKLRDLDHVERLDENDPAKRARAAAGPRTDGKLVLRDAAGRIVPEAVRGRAKQGFSAPDASWFRGESIDYVDSLLRNPRARIYEYLAYPYVTSRLDEHTSGHHNHRLFIWSLLSLEWWLRRFLEQ